MNNVIKIQFEKVWKLTLKSGLVIEGSTNLAESYEKAALYTWPKPTLSEVAVRYQSDITLMKVA